MHMNRIKLITQLLTLLILIVGLSGCYKTIDTKESYLKEYKSFVDEVKTNKNSYSEEDWKKKDETFDRFSKELYDKLENELTFFEQARVARYSIIYGSTRGIKALDKALEDGEIEDAIDDLTEYFDKDLEKDIDNVVKDLKEIWDEELKDDLSEKLKELKTKLEDDKFREDLNDKIDEIKGIINDEDIQEKLKDVSTELEELFKEIEKKMDKS